MRHDSLNHHRCSIRLRGYDYSRAGAYVITLVAHQRAHLFGKAVNDAMMLNAWGQIAQAEWLSSATIRREIELDAFVIMPNHIHGIVVIEVDDDHGNDAGASGGCLIDELANVTGECIRRMPQGEQVDRRSLGVRRTPLPSGPKPKSLGAFVAGYKSAVTKRINAMREMKDAPVWQRNYHDRIIRNERELNAFRKYIEDNPLQWALERENK